MSKMKFYKNIELRYMNNKGNMGNKSIGSFPYLSNFLYNSIPSRPTLKSILKTMVLDIYI